MTAKLLKLKIGRETDLADLSKIVRKADAQAGVLIYWSEEDGITVLGYHRKSKYKKVVQFICDKFEELTINNS